MQSRLALACGLAALGVAACGGDTVEGPPPAAEAQLRLVSPAFADGAELPRRYTCDGEDVSPPLRWSDPPAGTRELALLVEDPDAPDGTFVHWSVYGITPATRGFGEDALPANALEGENSFGDEDWGGPCPPGGDDPHRYRFLLYALDALSGLDAAAPPGDVRDAIEQRALARGALTATYGR